MSVCVQVRGAAADGERAGTAVPGATPLPHQLFVLHVSEALKALSKEVEVLKVLKALSLPSPTGPRHRARLVPEVD